MYKCTGLCLYFFFILFFPLFVKIEDVSESENYNGSWVGQFLPIESSNLYSASRLLTSESENAFLCFEILFFMLSVFVCLKLFFLVFVVLCECIQLFVYAGLLQDRIFDCLFRSCVLRLFVCFLDFSMT